MTSTTTPNTTGPTGPTTTVGRALAPRRTQRWSHHWRPEDPEFWESDGRRIARWRRAGLAQLPAPGKHVRRRAGLTARAPAYEGACRE